MKTISNSKEKSTSSISTQEKPIVAKSTIKDDSSSVKQKGQLSLKDKIESFQGQEISLEDMFKAGVHFGHQKSRWNPAMKDYIFTVRQGVHIIDLVKTEKNLKEAIELMRLKIDKGGQILFVGTKRQAKDIVKEAAEYCQMPYVVGRWLGGTLTNFEIIKKRIEKLSILEDLQEKGELKKYTKKEQSVFNKKIERFNKRMGGIKHMKTLPVAVFVVDTVLEDLAVKEASKMGIPIIGLVGTNADPKVVDVPIPTNDDAVKSLKFLLAYIVAKIKKS
ncbi:MAG: 30S ribosomal protein S2 [Patescibacteria group bacterium]|nr:30S ribosomal protein S2 [Patescibacteria group bacterium]